MNNNGIKDDKKVNFSDRVGDVIGSILGRVFDWVIGIVMIVFIFNIYLDTKTDGIKLAVVNGMNITYEELFDNVMTDTDWNTFLTSEGVITEFNGNLTETDSDICIQFTREDGMFSYRTWSVNGKVSDPISYTQFLYAIEDGKLEEPASILNFVDEMVESFSSSIEKTYSNNDEYIPLSDDYIEEDLSYDEQDYVYKEPTVYMWSDAMDIDQSKMDDFKYLKKYVEEAVFGDFTSKSFGEIINDKYDDISISLHQGPEGYPIGLIEGRLKTNNDIQIGINVSIQDGYLGINNVSTYDWSSTQKVPNDVTDVYKYLKDNVFPKNY